jgi:hypothetical protein
VDDDGGAGGVSGAVPVPESVTVEVPASWVTTRLALLLLADWGVKFTSRSHFASTVSIPATPTAQVVPPLLANSAAFAPLSATAVSDRGAFPVFVSVVLITVAVTPVGVAGKLSALSPNLAAPTGTVTPGPESATVRGEPLTLEVIVTVPVLAPAIAGVNVMLIVQTSPAARLPTQSVVDANSVFGADVTSVIETGIVLLLLLVTVICRGALASPTVCVLKTIDGALRMMLGVVTAAPIPETVMLGFVAALDWTVNVAESEPAYGGVNVAPIVQVAPGFTTTEAPTQLPVAVKSVAFAPLFSMPVIVSFSVPMFSNVMVEGVGVELATKTGVEAKVSVGPPLTLMAGCASAAHDAAASATPTSALNIFVVIDVVGMFIDFAFRLHPMSNSTLSTASVSSA